VGVGVRGRGRPRVPLASVRGLDRTLRVLPEVVPI
jgi:hypothetical protein